MTLRRTISLLAVVAMLVHAIAVARHVVAMTGGAPSAEQALLADLGVICHIDANGSAAAVDTPPAAPGPAAPAKCPICLGLVAAVVLTGSLAELLPPATGPPARLAISTDVLLIDGAATLRPPVRGPPLA